VRKAKAEKVFDGSLVTPLPKECVRCGTLLVDGICQNYGCESSRERVFVPALINGAFKPGSTFTDHDPNLGTALQSLTGTFVADRSQLKGQIGNDPDYEPPYLVPGDTAYVIAWDYSVCRGCVVIDHFGDKPEDGIFITAEFPAGYVPGDDMILNEKDYIKWAATHSTEPTYRVFKTKQLRFRNNGR